MTSTTKSEQDRSNTGTAASALLGAASVASKGPAGVGLLLAKQGYGLARKQAAHRRAATAERIAEANRARTSLTIESSSGSGRVRRILIVGLAASVLGGVVVFLGRRRNEVPPPADVPPRLSDYDDAVS